MARNLPRIVAVRDSKDPHGPALLFSPGGWRDLHRIGVGTTLVLPVTGQPILEVVSMGRTRIRVVMIRRAREWVFIWRPWWARIRMPGSWVWGEAHNAADIIATAAAA